MLRTGVIWKSGVGWWVTNRSGWLLELLTELKRKKSHHIQGDWEDCGSRTRYWSCSGFLLLVLFTIYTIYTFWFQNCQEIILNLLLPLTKKFKGRSHKNVFNGWSHKMFLTYDPKNVFKEWSHKMFSRDDPTKCFQRMIPQNVFKWWSQNCVQGMIPQNVFKW